MPVRAGPLYLDINHATGSYVSASRQHSHRFSTLMSELTLKDIAGAPAVYSTLSIEHALAVKGLGDQSIASGERSS